MVAEATKFLVNPSFTLMDNFDLLQGEKIWLHRCNPENTRPSMAVGCTMVPHTSVQPEALFGRCTLFEPE